MTNPDQIAIYTAADGELAEDECKKTFTTAWSDCFLVAHFCTVSGVDKDQSLSQWVAEITGSDSWRTVAEKLSTTYSTIKRQLGNRESDAIIELAAAYGANPISGLIAAGSISRADVMAYAGDLTVEQLSDVELARIMVNGPALNNF